MKTEITKRQTIILNILFERYAGTDNGKAYIEQDYMDEETFNLIFETKHIELYIDERGNVTHSGGKGYGNFEELNKKNIEAIKLGRKGGKAKTEKKAASSAKNGKKGGRPRYTHLIRDREAGNVIDKFKSIEEAEEELKIYEKNDKIDHIYIEDFYEIIKI